MIFLTALCHSEHITGYCFIIWMGRTSPKLHILCQWDVRL